MERQLPAVRVWLTTDTEGDGTTTGPLQERPQEGSPPAADDPPPAVSAATVSAAGAWLEPVVAPLISRRASSASCGSRRSSASAGSSGGAAHSSSSCSRCSRSQAALKLLDESRRASNVSRSSFGSARSSFGSNGSAPHSRALLETWQTRRTSRLSHTFSFGSQMDSQRRQSVYLVMGPLDDGLCPLPARLTLTQRLAFPGLTEGSEVRRKRRDPFHETEAHMNLFAKLITVAILCLVFVLLIGVLYKFLR